jgi:hypothetical protein
MAATSSTIKIIFDGSARGVVAAAATARVAVAALTSTTSKIASVARTAASGLLLASKAMVAMAAATAAAKAVAGLVTVLAHLAPLALTIPAALAGIGAVFATLKIGLSGISDSFKNTKAGKEAFDKLADSAKQFVTAVKEAKGAFEDLKKSVQGALFNTLAAQFRALATIYVPILKTGLTGIATELNKVAVGFAAALKSGQAQGAVRTILEGTRKALEGMGPAAQNVTTALLELSAFGISQFKNFGKEIENVTAKFKRFVETGIRTGSFTKALDGAKTTLHQLKEIAIGATQSVIILYRGLSGGATGGGTAFLDTINAKITQLNATLKSTAGQDALKKLGNAFSVVGQNVGDIFGAALKALLPIVQAIAPVLAVFSSILRDTLVPALQTIGPALAQMASAVGSALIPVMLASVRWSPRSPR